MYIIGIIIISFAIFSAAGAASLLNLVVMGTNLLVIIGVILGTSSAKLFISGLRGVLSAKYEMSNEVRQDAVGLFNLLSKVVILTTILLFFVGISLVFWHTTWSELHDIEFQSFMHGIAISMSVPIYGIFLSVAFFKPAAYILSKTRKMPDSK